MSVEKQLEAVEGKVEDRSLAMEILIELKKTIGRLWIIILILIGVLVASNFYWLYTFTQYDFISYEQSTEGGGNANIVAGDGDIINGETNGKDQDQKGQ